MYVDHAREKRYREADMDGPIRGSSLTLERPTVCTYIFIISVPYYELEAEFKDEM
jgi:hypothetical protein